MSLESRVNKVSTSTIVGGAIGLGVGLFTGASAAATGLYTLSGAVIGGLASNKYSHSYK